MVTLRHNKALLGTYMMTLLYAFHYGIPLYATSSYLGFTFSTPAISFLFALASLVTFFLSLHITKYIRRFHTYSFTQGAVASQIIITIALAFTQSPILLAIFFISHFVLTSVLYVSINTFVERFSPHHETGTIRGMFLTILNLGILISPFFGGAILERGGYQTLYIVSALILIPFMFLLHRFMQHMPEPQYSKIELIEAFKTGWKNKDIRITLIALFLLESFYAIMVIYSPMYLMTQGISLPLYLTAILPVALLPLVLMPYELGILADTRLGEKELLIAGLLIMSLFSLFIAITSTSNIIVWILLFFFSRVGAALVETMTFTYYFKKIKSSDIGLITLFSNVRSMAVVVAPCVGIFLTPFMSVYPGIIFIMLSLVLLYGALQTFSLHDTR